MQGVTRRKFVLTSAGLLAVYTVPTLSALRPLTPRQTPGLIQQFTNTPRYCRGVFNGQGYFLTTSL